MNWGYVVGLGLSVVSTAAAVGMYFVVSSIKVAILELELRLTVERIQDREEIKKWAEARFVGKAG